MRYFNLSNNGRFHEIDVHEINDRNEYISIIKKDLIYLCKIDSWFTALDLWFFQSKLAEIGVNDPYIFDVCISVGFISFLNGSHYIKLNHNRKKDIVFVNQKINDGNLISGNIYTLNYGSRMYISYEEFNVECGCHKNVQDIIDYEKAIQVLKR